MISLSDLPAAFAPGVGNLSVGSLFKEAGRLD